MRFLTIGIVFGVGCGGSAEEFVDTDTDITWGNGAPNAHDDSAEARPGMLQSLGVLGNDFEPDNEVLSITAVSGSDNAIIDIAEDKWSIYYTADDTFTGTDTFTYTVSDPWGSTDEATVSVEVTPVPTLVVTAPVEGAVTPCDGCDTATMKVNIDIEFELTGCTASSPSQSPDECHLHRWINDVKYSQAEPGASFGWYKASPIDDMWFEKGENTVKLQVIKNDGSDAPFTPYIEDEVTFTVE